MSKQEIDILINECNEKLYSIPREVKKIALKAYKLSNQECNSEGIVKSAYYLGMSLQYSGKVKEALEYLFIGKELCELENIEIEELVEIYKAIGVTYLEKDEIDNTIDYFINGLELARKIKYYLGEMKILYNLANCYSDYENLEKAMSCYEKALLITNNIHVENGIVISIKAAIAGVLVKNEEFDKAEEIIIECLELLKDENDLLSETDVYYVQGKIEKAKKNYVKSLELFKKCLKIFLEFELVFNIDRADNEIIELYIDMEKYDEAIDLLKRQKVKYIKENRYKLLLQTYEKFANIYYKKGDMEKFVECIEISKDIRIKDEIAYKTHQLSLAENKLEMKNISAEKDRLKTINKELNEVSEMCKSIASESNLKQVIIQAYDNIEKVLGIAEFKMILFKSDKKSGYTVADGKDKLILEGYDSEIRDLILNSSEIFEYKEIKDKTQYYARLVNGEDIKITSIVAIPMVEEKEIIGTLIIYNHLLDAFEETKISTLKVLISFISVAISNADNIKKNKAITRKFDALSKLDPLAQIPNRRYFNMYVKELMDLSIKNKEYVAVALIDIDFFKMYNDYCGHLEGDNAIVVVSQVLKDTIDSYSDFLARYGGEEFVIVARNRDLDSMYTLAEDIRRNVENTTICMDCDDSCKNITISIGITASKICEGTNIEELINQADVALYKAKENGRNLTEIFDEN